MARVKIAPAKPDTLNEELARLRKFDVETLRGRWCSLFGRRAPSHLPRHLLIAFSPTGCRRTGWATWTRGASVRSNGWIRSRRAVALLLCLCAHRYL